MLIGLVLGCWIREPGPVDESGLPEDECEGQELADWFQDLDGDGHGDDDVTVRGCVAPQGYVAQGGDCAPGDAEVHPEAEERCDGVDNDCDGETDEEDAVDATTFYADADGDGYGDPQAATLLCELAQGYSTDSTDCDDGDGQVSPGAEEVCDDGVDNDCDGTPGDCRWTGDHTVDEAAGTMTVPSGMLGAGRVVGWAGDLDGDGHTDLVAGGSGSTQASGMAYVLFGPFDQGLGEPDLVLAGSSHPSFWNGYAPLGPGDLDGDGQADLLVGPAASNSQELHLLSGPLAAGNLSLEDASDRVLGCSWCIGVYFEVDAGDLDGDGDLDLAVGDGGYSSVQGTVRVLEGPLDSGATQLFQVDGVTAGFVGASLDAGGDLDGDGVADLAVGARGSNATRGAVGVFLGPLSGSARVDTGEGWFEGGEGSWTGWTLGVAGDMDGDGRDDLVVSALFGDAAYLLLGPATGVGSVSSRAHATLQGAGAVVDGAGDFDGDGHPDVVVTAGTGGVGDVYLAYGPLSGAVDLGSAGFRVLGGELLLGSDLAGGVDADGDGMDDLIIGAGSAAGGAVLLFTGRGM